MKLPMMAAAAALMMMAGVASAQPMGGGSGPMAAVRKACAADMAQLCPGKSGKEAHECMMANKDKVSDGCKSAAAAAMKARQDAMSSQPQ